MTKTKTAAPTIEELEADAEQYRINLAQAERSRAILYAKIDAAKAAHSVRAIAKATELSPGRVNQIQHGK